MSASIEPPPMYNEGSDELPDEGSEYDAAKRRIEIALHLGRDHDEIAVSYGNIPEIAAWLASEGIR